MIAESITPQDKTFLQRAIEVAHQSVQEGGFPAGAVVVKDGRMIGEGLSLGFKLHDPTCHAETVAIREACQQLKTSDLNGAVLYSSLQPCLMCFSAANWAGISSIVFAASKTQEMVSKQYYEGAVNLEKINEENNRKMVLKAVTELEGAALESVIMWEKLK